LIYQQPGNADIYEGLKITYIVGRDPILVIKDETTGQTIETISLIDYTTKGLHELMEKKGFKRKGNLKGGIV